MTTGRETLPQSEIITIAAIEQDVPLLVKAREVITAFCTMTKRKQHHEVDGWLRPNLSGQGLRRLTRPDIQIFVAPDQGQLVSLVEAIENNLGRKPE